jgi:hypothetical protein
MGFAGPGVGVAAGVPELDDAALEEIISPERIF